MCEIKPVVLNPFEDGGHDEDWAAAKAFFDNLKTLKPRPVGFMVKSFVYSELVCTFFANTLWPSCSSKR